MTERPDLDAIEALLAAYDMDEPFSVDHARALDDMSDYAPAHLRTLLTYARALEQERDAAQALLADQQSAFVVAVEAMEKRHDAAIAGIVDGLTKRLDEALNCAHDGTPLSAVAELTGTRDSIATLHAAALARHAAEVERRHEALRAEGDRVVTAVYDALIRFAAEAGHDVKSELDDEMSPELPEFTCPSSDPADYARGLARGIVDALVEKVGAKVRAEIEAEWEAEMSAEVERARGVEAEAERDELLATLANEHGDGPPPSEGWEFLGHDGPRSTWRRYLVGGGDGPYTAAYVSREIDNYLGRVRWHWYIVRDSPGESPRFTTLAEGHADYAREGMRAGDATLTPGGSDAR